MAEQSGDARRLTPPEAWCRRLASMGIEARVMRGGRAALASMPLDARPFPALERSVRFERVVFATVGTHQIKCLKPEALFALPLVDVRGCASAGDLEERIRAAWRARQEELGRVFEALRSIGARASARDPDSVIRIPIEGEGDWVAARAIGSGRIVLPSRGTLEGIALDSPEERVLSLPAMPATESELQIAITNRLEQLARNVANATSRSRARLVAAGATEAPRVGVASHRILLVGPRLSRNRAAHDSLALRGYTVLRARDASEALRMFERTSPELVITEADLGRAEGLELVPQLAQLMGVDHMPVIVVDPNANPARRAAARDIGAVGYLAGRLDVAKIADRLAAMLDAPKRRRFTRYAQPLAVRIAGARHAATATALSRGGIYVATDENLPAQSLQRCELVLAATGRRVEVEALVLYRLGNGGRERRGVGMRFDRFGADGEAAYLDFLRDVVAA